MANPEYENQASRRLIFVIAAVCVGLLTFWLFIRSREPAPSSPTETTLPSY
jgi:hypothetical protein